MPLCACTGGLEKRMVLRWMLFMLAVSILASITAGDTVDCPVCERVIRASKELGTKQGVATSAALEKYCDVPTIEVDEQKFCYNIATLKKEVNRLLDLGADENRVCKKVKSVNPDFCLAKVVKAERTGIQINERLKKGIIYE